MRPLEYLVVISNFWALCCILVATSRQRMVAAGIGSVVVAAQLLIEGHRWQMSCAYFLTILFAVIIVVQKLSKKQTLSIFNDPSKLRSTFRIASGLIVYAFSILLPISFPIFKLPDPHGNYCIGTISKYRIDSTRTEIFSADTTVRRQLVIQIWYPIKKSEGTERQPYVDDAITLSSNLAREMSANGLIKLPPYFFDHFKYVMTNAIPAAPPIADEKFPVLIYLTGLDGFRQVSSIQIEHLVANGYIVVGIDQPYTAAVTILPDGTSINGLSKPFIEPLIDQSIKPLHEIPSVNGHPLQDGIIPYLANDVKFILDQLDAMNSTGNDPLKGHLDLSQVGVFGVSLGAMVSAEASFIDPRIRACVMMDAAMPFNVAHNGLKQPAMWLTRSANDMRLERESSGGWTERDILQTISTMEMTFRMSGPKTAYYIKIPGMFHINFTDAPAWSPLLQKMGLTGPINRERGFEIVNLCLLRFFDSSLRSRSDESITESLKQYPKVEVTRNPL